jgi:hypothetical protein
MNFNLKQRKAELEAELAKINKELSRKPTPEERFWEIVRSINRPFLTKIGWPNEIFFFRNNDYIMSYHKESKILWCSWEHLWSILENEYEMKYDDIQGIIKVEVEKALKVEGVTPPNRLISSLFKVEKALKVEGVTPHTCSKSSPPGRRGIQS